VGRRLSAPPHEAVIWAATLTRLKMGAEGPFRRDIGNMAALTRRKYHAASTQPAAAALSSRRDPEEKS